MEVLIKIPDKKFKAIQKCFESGFTLDMVSMAILNGKPLPKGHGDLKDADKLAIKIAMIRDTHNAYSNDEYERALFQAYDICVDKIIDARTIIEADKEEDE